MVGVIMLCVIMLSVNRVSVICRHAECHMLVSINLNRINLSVIMQCQ
jgi:hypothetical protein